MSRAQTTALILSFHLSVLASAQTNFVNFETAPVHPIALSPDGNTLAVCNLPAAGVEFFGGSERSTPLGSVPVGIDPVTVRFRTSAEAWVVNTISDCINVIDVASLTLQRVISTRDGPADLVFAGNPLRAYVSCPPENVVLVIHPDTGAIERTIPLKAERPKALAVSRDGQTVYVASLESGNGTTIIAPRLTDLGHVPPGGPVDLPISPYGGENPPPNSGTNFLPAISSTLSNPPPKVSMIVKRQSDGRWLDDNNGDWTDLVTGTNAPLTGRIEGWDLLDHDVAVIDTTNFQPTYIKGLMNICFGLAVNPQSGALTVVGTEALNHVRFEPALQSIFTRVHLALVGDTNRVLDLNPHLDYQTRTLPLAQRSASIGDPRALAWNAEGTKLYVAGMGSDNLLVLNATGERIGTPISLPAGPAGLVVDDARNRIFVFSRFEATVTILDATTLATIESISLFDPTPSSIRKGRVHFYNTHKNSGLGQASCSSCHIDGKTDRLAWDLGTPTGEIKSITSTTYNFGNNAPARTNHFHPMKGPMVTQTLQDIIGHEPFHWRGDRFGIEEFNPTFSDLQGADELTAAEMQEFKDFLASLHFPPNRYRNFDNSLPRFLPLPGQLALGRGSLPKGAPLPNGDAAAGVTVFLTCNQCHSFPSGLGPDKFFQTGLWRDIAPGPNGERHVALSAVERSHDLPFKIPHLRSLPEKIGFSLNSPSSAGFGFFHDGRSDTLTRFIQDGFNITDDKQTADLLAFLLAFSGSDLPKIGTDFNQSIVPGTFSRDTAAAVGRQIVVNRDLGEIDPLISRAVSSTGRVDLVIKTRINGTYRGWLYNRVTRNYRPDSGTNEITRTQLFNTSREGPLSFLLVPRGSGIRLGIDRDEDGTLDFDEPSQAVLQQQMIAATAIRLENRQFIIEWPSAPGRKYQLLMKTRLEEKLWRVLFEDFAIGPVITKRIPLNNASAGYFRIQLLPE